MNTTKTPRNKMTGFAMRGGIYLEDLEVPPVVPAVTCRICGDPVESTPMMTRTCYDCYRSLLPTIQMVNERRARDIAAFDAVTQEMSRVEVEKDAAEAADWLGRFPLEAQTSSVYGQANLAELKAQDDDWKDEQDTRESVRP